MTECINLVVTKETTSEEILAFILTDSQYHTYSDLAEAIVVYVQTN